MQFRVSINLVNELLVLKCSANSLSTSWHPHAPSKLVSWIEKLAKIWSTGGIASLDTKIGQINLCHILMSYSSFNVIMTFDVIWKVWHQNMTWVNLADLGVERSGWITGIEPTFLFLAKKLFKHVNIEKRVRQKTVNFSHYEFWWSFFVLHKSYGSNLRLVFQA